MHLPYPLLPLAISVAVAERVEVDASIDLQALPTVFDTVTGKAQATPAIKDLDFVIGDGASGVGTECIVCTVAVRRKSIGEVDFAGAFFDGDVDGIGSCFANIGEHQGVSTRILHFVGGRAGSVLPQECWGWAAYFRS